MSGLLFDEPGLVFHEKAEILARRVSAPAVIEDAGRNPFPVEGPPEKQGIGRFGETVSGAKNDDALPGGSAGRKRERGPTERESIVRRVGFMALSYRRVRSRGKGIVISLPLFGIPSRA